MGGGGGKEGRIGVRGVGVGGGGRQHYNWVTRVSREATGTRVMSDCQATAFFVVPTSTTSLLFIFISGEGERWGRGGMGGGRVGNQSAPL